MKKHRSLRFVMVVVVAAHMGVDGRSPAEVEADVRVIGGGSDAARLVDWAVERFAAAGLWLPGVDVRVHASKAGCDGHSALTRHRTDRRVVELCTSGQGREVVERLLLLHEFAHVWVGQNVDAQTRRRFLALFGLSVWSDPRERWERHGTEHAAETVAWGVFDEGVRLIGAVTEDEERLRAGFELLTGLGAVGGDFDHSVAERATDFDVGRQRDDEGRRLMARLSGRAGLTLKQFAGEWERAVRTRGLPARLGDWTHQRGGALAVAEVTSQVRLVASLAADGSVSAVTLVAGEDGLYDRYDTVLTWSLLLQVLSPHQSTAVWAGAFDGLLDQVGNETRGHVHLGGVQSDSPATPAQQEAEPAGVLS